MAAVGPLACYFKLLLAIELLVACMVSRARQLIRKKLIGEV